MSKHGKISPYSIRLSEEMRRQLGHRAVENGRSLQREMLTRLEESLSSDTTFNDLVDSLDKLEEESPAWRATLLEAVKKAPKPLRRHLAEGCIQHLDLEEA